MKYRIIIQPSAEADIGEIYFFLREVYPPYADRWLLSLHQAIDTLREMPRRCRLSPQGDDEEEEIRHLLHGDYRILFAIAGREVHVLHVRHSSFQSLES
ncbi:MAG TPA: type II toxin-antitoxin system RelE/ParE family toxin [Longimicrobium sp.]